MLTLINKDPRDRLKVARNLLGLTRKEFGEHSGISVNTLRAWETGTNPISHRAAKKISEGFEKCGLQCPSEWILAGSGLAPREFNSLSKHNNSLTIEVPAHSWDEELAIFKEIQFFESLNPNAIVIAVSEDSMQPFYSIGEYVGGIRTHNEELALLLGENCIITTLEGHVFVRKLQKGSKNDHFTCYALNPNSTTEEPILYNIKLSYAAKIIWHRKRL